MAGKPVFILNNNIHTQPGENDWRGESINRPSFDILGRARYQIIRNNQLWFSENDDFQYKFYLNLENGYSENGYYTNAVEIGNKIYIIPGSAQQMLIVENKKVKKIEFEKHLEPREQRLGKQHVSTMYRGYFYQWRGGGGSV